MTRQITTAAIAGLVLAGGLAAFGWQDAPKRPDEPPAAKQAAGQGGFPDLVKGLKATPGCLGVETARTSSGKNVIFAWFENKKAAMAWYKSDMHSMLIEGYTDGATGREPMKNVKDPDRPILAIASITMADKPKFEAIKMPISQIAIELYQPVDGGLFLGGRFSPEGMVVPGMKDYTPRE